jgi:hypothetical protein
MSLRGVLRKVEGGYLVFWCPGCRSTHMISSSWEFDGNFDTPTIRPSILITSGHYVSTHKPGDPCWCTFNAARPGITSFKCLRCHSFVNAGQIQFLADCTHELVGQTVKLEPFVP